jgi:hypothetical protein
MYGLEEGETEGNLPVLELKEYPFMGQDNKWPNKQKGYKAVVMRKAQLSHHEKNINSTK